MHPWKMYEHGTLAFSTAVHSSFRFYKYNRRTLYSSLSRIILRLLRQVLVVFLQLCEHGIVHDVLLLDRSIALPLEADARHGHVQTEVVLGAFGHGRRLITESNQCIPQPNVHLAAIAFSAVPPATMTNGGCTVRRPSRSAYVFADSL